MNEKKCVDCEKVVNLDRPIEYVLLTNGMMDVVQCKECFCKALEESE